MATYAIGDIQGCYDEFILLLNKINFSEQDTLWIAGDLVNRGPKSLETLRFIKKLGRQAKVVLGNHDLHLLAVYYTQARLKKSDTLTDILQASDCADLLHWLRQQPLVHYDPKLDIIMSHAGFPLNWDTQQVLTLSSEVSSALKGDNHLSFLQAMYGNQPNRWSDSLIGVDRLRCITNYLTRMRFCQKDYSLDLTFKGEIGSQPNNLIPWFKSKTRNNYPTILFGHWASLMGQTHHPKFVALDTGCVWGERLTAYCIDTREKFHIDNLNRT